MRSRVANAIVRALALSVSMMAEAAAPARHKGMGIARRAAFHERQRTERAELEAEGGAVLPAEEGPKMAASLPMAPPPS